MSTENLDRYASEHRERLKFFLEETHAGNARIRKRSRFFHQEVNRLVASQVVSDRRVLDVGCGDGGALRSVRPSFGIGLDLDPNVVADAREVSPKYVFEVGAVEDFELSFEKAFDYILAIGLMEQVYDVYTVLSKFQSISGQDTRIVVVTYSRLWQPLLRLAERLRLKTMVPEQNWIPQQELVNLAEQVDLELVTKRSGVLIPFRIPLISRWVNRWLAPLPIIRLFNIAELVVFRNRERTPRFNSVSILVPARNEAGNIAEILDRIPMMALRQEVVLVEGNSTDDTWEVIVAECESRKGAEQTYTKLKQPGIGKGDAVRAGFDAASGEIFIILDADLSVPPEELPRFIRSLNSGTAEFVNGSRLVYSMEDEAMRFLNLLGNRFFGALFTFLLGQQVRDTLCGTKALSRENYQKIVANRAYFGEFDPFGDFDLLFGSAALNLRIRDEPVHYKARTYGSTNISRFRHGILLIRMSWFAARKLRFI